MGTFLSRKRARKELNHEQTSFTFRCIGINGYSGKSLCSYGAKKPSSLEDKPKKKIIKKLVIPSEWSLIFDTETTIDAAQKLRFGTYQIRNGDALYAEGLFYDRTVLTLEEQSTLQNYSKEHALDCSTIETFIEEVFYELAFYYRATVIGFNLPFDLSRLAIDHTPARTVPWDKSMQGGFSFQLSRDKKKPRVQIKHRSSRDSFIRFAALGQRTNRLACKKNYQEPTRRGFFLDVKTLAAALTSQSHSLDSLAKTLRVSNKAHTTSHGKILTANYIKYALQDTQTTWECYHKLRELYDLHGLTQTPLHKIHSEASLGKAYLREMGIQPWKQIQPDFPPEHLGIIMSTYYGGRSEIHLRRQATQVIYCDFLSMYPTVCTLMGLWQFVIAQGMTWQETTQETQIFLENIDLTTLQQKETWSSLVTLVKVISDSEIFPIRAKYGDEAQYTIGLNHLYSQDGTAIWYTLADCIAAKLLTGKAPKIIEAISFKPKATQTGLKHITIAGNKDSLVDPRKGDFFKQIIDLRSNVKVQIKTASAVKQAELENQQFALKILANATSYGIFVEFNVEDRGRLEALNCYGPSGEAFSTSKSKFEEPGAFFHPLLATCITGAARLMLAITERLALENSLDWAFCDTDSMALAKPLRMAEDEFRKKALNVQKWFEPLNPYEKPQSLLKIEDYNYERAKNGELTAKLEPLFCFAISSKRYALFNLNRAGNPILRKVSAHGLGHLIEPYTRRDRAMLEDVNPWQQDFWLEILKAALNGNPHSPNFADLKNFDTPATSRYAQTTPTLGRWFSTYNSKRNYTDWVRPFNFLLSMSPKKQLSAFFEEERSTLRPIAPYHKKVNDAVQNCFDRETGKPIEASHLQTYKEALAQYHLHPETKFSNGDYRDRGVTKRRHIQVRTIQHIGKEANRWEEQFYLGYDPEEQIEYGASKYDQAQILEIIKNAVKRYHLRPLAKEVGISYQQLSAISSGKSQPRLNTVRRVMKAIDRIKNRGGLKLC